MGFDVCRSPEVVGGAQNSTRVAGTKRSGSPVSSDEALGRANKKQTTAPQQLVSSSQFLLGIGRSSFEERLRQWVQRADSSKQENRIEAQRRILDAQKSNAEKLDLSNLNLTEVPPLDVLTNLKELNLSSNQLSELKGRCFGGLTMLEELELNNNQLMELKEGPFDGLPNLGVLDLSNNKLRNFKEKWSTGVPPIYHLNLNKNYIAKGVVLHENYGYTVEESKTHEDLIKDIEEEKKN